MLSIKKHRVVQAAKITLSSFIALVGIGVVGAAISPASPAQQDAKTPAATQRTVENSQKSPTLSTPKVTKSTVVETVSIPFETRTFSDTSLAIGSSRTVTVGVPGTQRITYEVTYIDGKESSRLQTASKVVKTPVHKVVYEGTKPKAASIPTNCPNGTYINSAGNTVCRPYVSSGAPAGATARCVDGTYSFSQSRRGTCSHHGGVASWL